MRISFFSTARITDTRPIPKWWTRRISLRSAAPSDKFVSALLRAKTRKRFRLNDISEKARNCNKTEFQVELFSASRGEKTATANQFYNGLCRALPKLIFLHCYSCYIALGVYPLRVPPSLRPPVTFMSWSRVEFPAKVVNRIIKTSESSYVGTPQPFCARVPAQ